MTRILKPEHSLFHKVAQAEEFLRELGLRIEPHFDGHLAITDVDSGMMVKYLNEESRGEPFADTVGSFPQDFDGTMLRIIEDE